MTETSVTSMDPRPVYEQAADYLGALVAAVRPDQLDGPTPCAGWTVRDLLSHLVAATEGIAVLGETGTAPGGSGMMSAAQIADDGWGAALAAARAHLSAVWADDTKLDEVFQLPWGPKFPGRVTLAIPVFEAVVHGWDLARATGGQRRPEPGPVRFAEAVAGQFAPAGERDGRRPFGPVQTAPAEADAQDRLAAFLGRPHDWSPAA
ncbi:TIGR03086 family metal-binding protein [Streptomyces hoynatensis]|nr:TIGR03086 family metal-binding protein [Streptomyces hoynatensis]